MLLNEIINYLELLFPLKDQEDWDFSGFSCKPKKNIIVKNIFYALDFNWQAFKLLQQKKDINLVITHHPFIFSKNKKNEFNALPYKKEMYQYCYKNNIAIYSLHTNYDNNFQGTSYQIAKFLGFESNIKITNPNYPCLVETNQSFANLITKMKKTFKWKKLVTNLQTNSNYFEDETKKKIAFFAGSGDIENITTFNNEYKFDLLITSDIKWSDKVFFNDLDLKYLIVPHTIEQVFINHIIFLVKNINKNIGNKKFIIKISEKLV